VALGQPLRFPQSLSLGCGTSAPGRCAAVGLLRREGGDSRLHRLAARAIHFAVVHDRREVWVGFPTVKAIITNRFAPGLLNRYLARSGYQGQLSQQSQLPDAPNSLYAPAPNQGDIARPLRRWRAKLEHHAVHRSAPPDAARRSRRR